jgi:lipoprotein NlpI
MRIKTIAYAALAALLLATLVLALPWTWWRTCNDETALDRAEACTSIIQSMLVTKGMRAIAYNNRGKALMYELDRAIADFTEAIRLDPKYAPAYSNRGLAWHLKDDLEQAIADFNEAIRLDPKDAAAYRWRGAAWREKGDFDRMIADYTEVIRLDPKDATAYFWRGTAWFENRNFDRAIAEFDQAIQLNPNAGASYNGRGDAWRLKGNLDRAIADYTEAIRLIPEYPRAYCSRGIAYFYSGSLAKALADVNQASQLDPRDAFTALWVDVVGQRNNVPSRLVQAISAIDMTKWPAPVIRLFLGEMTLAAVLAAAEDPDAQKNHAQICEANFHGGQLALRQGAKQEAQRLFRLAVNDCLRTGPVGPRRYRALLAWDAANAELKALGDSKP